MNTERLTLSIIILALCSFCFTQTATGCAKAKGKTKETAEAKGGIPISFAERPSNVAPGSWQPISGTVVSQIESQYQAHSIKVDSLERSGSGANAVRMVLMPREGVSQKKQLLDGLRVLYETFPEQDDYEARIKVDSDPGVHASWPDMLALDKAGYNYDTPQDKVDQFWSKLSHPDGAPQDSAPASTGSA